MSKKNKVQYFSTAAISECKKYRYSLDRIWDFDKPRVLFIMHNPSTANENTDDPTIRRCIKFAQDWGYGGICVGNLFPYRATDPKELLKLEHEEMADTCINEVYLSVMANECERHILAFGNPIAPYLHSMLPKVEWEALKLTKKGNPCHPLYLRSDLKPFTFKPR